MTLLTRSYHNLRTVNLASAGVVDGQVYLLCRHNTQLTQLTLDCNDQLTNKALTSIAEHLVELEVAPFMGFIIHLLYLMVRGLYQVHYVRCAFMV